MACVFNFLDAESPWDTCLFRTNKESLVQSVLPLVRFTTPVGDGAIAYEIVLEFELTVAFDVCAALALTNAA